MNLMKKLLVVAVFAVFLPLSAFASNVNLSWNASATTGVKYNVYRAQGGAFAKITPSGVSGLTFSDTTVIGGTTYTYQVTAFCDATTTCPAGITGESAPTNVVTAVVPTTTPGSPSNLTITAIAFNHLTPKKDQIVASWVDTASPSKNSVIVLSDNRLVTKKMNLTSADGHYTFTWAGKSLAVNARLLVCNTDGKCDMREIVL